MSKRQNRKYGGKIRPVTKLWTMGDGEQIKICDMTDRHLKNAINCVQRIAKTNMKQTGGGSCPDEFWYEEEPYSGPEDVVAEYSDLLREAKRRNLVIL